MNAETEQIKTTEPAIELLSTPCVECGKRLSPDEFYYGHDCE